MADQRLGDCCRPGVYRVYMGVMEKNMENLFSVFLLVPKREWAIFGWGGLGFGV